MTKLGIMAVAAANKPVPTQAQIEAAIEAFCKSAGYPIKYELAENSQLKRDIIAALTAAAERTGQEASDNATSSLDELLAPLTAEQTHLVSEIHRQHKEIERLKVQVIERDSAIAGWIKRKAATIERCAQVADDYGKNRWPDIAKTAYGIAAAIRALKDS